MIRRSNRPKTQSNRVKAKSNRVSAQQLRNKTAKQKRSQDYGDDWDLISKECKRLHGGKCAKCGETGNNAHHIIPLSKGGRNIQSNLQWLCECCHDGKHKHMQKRKIR